MSANELGFMRAICEAPDEDTTRLVYADWLDEQGEECGGCKGSGRSEIVLFRPSNLCPMCMGSGQPSHDARGYQIKCRVCQGTGHMEGEAEIEVRPCNKCGGTGQSTQFRDRAAFIRLQVERAAIVAREDAGGFDHDVCNKPDCDRCRLRRECKVLFDRADPNRWLGELPGWSRHAIRSNRRQACLGWVGRHESTPAWSATTIRAHHHRGLVKYVICHPRAWVTHAHKLTWNADQKIRCPQCGWHDALTGSGNCFDCGGKGYVAQPFHPAAQPVTGVILTDYPSDADLTLAAALYPQHRQQLLAHDQTGPVWSTDHFDAFASAWPWLKFQMGEPEVVTWDGDV